MAVGSPGWASDGASESVRSNGAAAGQYTAPSTGVNTGPRFTLAMDRVDPAAPTPWALEAKQIGRETAGITSPAAALEFTNDTASRSTVRLLPSSISSYRPAASLQTSGSSDPSDGEESGTRDPWQFDVLPQASLTGGLLLTASVLWWATHGGGLLTAMMASVPMWRSFDPLPVLMSDGARGDGELPKVPDQDKEAAVPRGGDKASVASATLSGTSAAHERTMLEELAGKG